MEKTRLLLCDLDGTLVDSRRDLATAVNLTRGHYGLAPLGVETVTKYVGDGVRKLVERSLADAGAAIDLDEALELQKRFYQERMLDETSLYPTVADGVRVLRAAGWRLAVATNKPAAMVPPMLRHLGLDGYFDLVLGADAGLPLKPDPAMVEHAMSTLGAAPGDTWIIGDGRADLQVGKAAGIKVCLAKYGFAAPVDDLQWDLAVDSFGELAGLLISQQIASDSSL